MDLDGEEYYDVLEMINNINENAPDVSTEIAKIKELFVCLLNGEVLLANGILFLKER